MPHSLETKEAPDRLVLRNSFRHFYYSQWTGRRRNIRDAGNCFALAQRENGGGAKQEKDFSEKGQVVFVKLEQKGVGEKSRGGGLEERSKTGTGKTPSCKSL
ncbi:MAG: hypothetical protein LLG01_02130 [Planctomycetaceae bacterium]|nr:hypothetical protein [Planctomycetaceae bacterium]